MGGNGQNESLLSMISAGVCFGPVESAMSGCRVSTFAREVPALGQGQILLRVGYSSVGFKDHLITSAANPFRYSGTRVLGNDATGTVLQSQSDRVSVGEIGLVIGRELGTGAHGGLAEFLVLSEDDFFPLPSGWSERDAIALGVPGFTASLIINSVVHFGGKVPENFCVTGAGGAVGGFLIEMASILGVHMITAVSSRSAREDELILLGAHKVLPSKFFSRTTPMKLLPERWDAVADLLGGNTLSTLLKSLSEKGIAISVGMAEATNTAIELAPFFLRGVSLHGINLEQDWSEKREVLSRTITRLWPIAMLERQVVELRLADLPDFLGAPKNPGLLPRTIVNMEEP